MDAPSPERMSAEEAAAKADALIAQYRATAPRAKRGAPRVSSVPSVSGHGLAYVKTALVFVLGCVAGANWRAHPVWSLIVGIVAAVLAVRIVRSGQASVAASGDLADR